MAINEKRIETLEEIEISDKFLNIEYKLDQELRKLHFGPPVKYVYNPLDYAKEMHINFVKNYFHFKGEKIFFLGMNPGPWGMCQTGVPFGDIKTVKDWFRIRCQINHPEQEHPARVVTGLACTKVEESGRKFWKLIKELCDKPENFFKHCLVHNYCPLAFFSESGENLTPPQIKAHNTKELFELCDSALTDIIVELEIKKVVAIGKFAETRALKALKKRNISAVHVGCIPHPSSRNAKYKADWDYITIQRLKDLDVYRLLIES